MDDRKMGHSPAAEFPLWNWAPLEEYPLGVPVHIAEQRAAEQRARALAGTGPHRRVIVGPHRMTPSDARGAGIKLSTGALLTFAALRARERAA